MVGLRFGSPPRRRAHSYRWLVLARPARGGGAEAAAVARPGSLPSSVSSSCGAGWAEMAARLD
jgi:hypothetical protein